MIVGMDFGTTNSGMSVYDGRELQRLPLDPANENPRIVRTALYITNGQDVYIGRDAVNRYFDHNLGRPVKLQKVWVGEIEVIADLVYFVQDAYVWIDVLSPGRLFLSFKTNLRDELYTGTVIGQFFYPLEALVAIYLHLTRRRAQELLGRELKEVVLGRPVRFADDKEHDNLAQERLLRGAFQAGYETVYLQPEPIAAAYHYASLSSGPQNILVFDFGGGTLDITVMRLQDSQRRVLATGGVPIAGDIFDQKIVRARLPRHFGEGGLYGPKKLPVPTWIYDTFSNWQTILELQSPDNRRILQEIEQTAQRPRDIRALNSLVSGNYGLQMFDAVEKTKRTLSERMGGMIRFGGPDFDVMELMTRRDFEAIIRPEYLRIERELDETLRASGLRPAQIDAVIRTGGSAEIPVFQQMLQKKFGPDRVHSVDTFGSVTSGLGIIAHGIAAGEIDARPYTRADLKQQEVTVSRPNVSVVDMRLLKRRIQAQAAFESEGPEEATTKSLVLLDRDNYMHAWSGGALDALDLAQISVATALITTVDEPLLLVTSRYRFVISSARQLMDLASLQQSLAELHHFKPRERVYAVARWQPLQQAPRLLLVTSLGYARAYPTDVMRAAIEAPAPLIFEQPLPGWPIALLGASDDQQLVLVTDGGRGLRRETAAIPGAGLQLLNREEDESIIAARLAAPEAELLLVSDNGYARRLPLDAVPPATKTNQPGRVLMSRRPLRAALALADGQTPQLLTRHGLQTVDAHKIPLEPDSTRSHGLLPLAKGDAVLQVVIA